MWDPDHFLMRIKEVQVDFENSGPKSQTLVADPAKATKSFLDKLNKVKTFQEKDPAQKTRPAEGDMHLLGIDMLQTNTEIVLYAQLPGVAISELEIVVDKERDVISIKGKQKRPQILDDNGKGIEDEAKLLKSECAWGPFYREIVLPAEINVSAGHAKLDNGVLVLRAPYLKQGQRVKSVERKLEVEKNA